MKGSTKGQAPGELANYSALPAPPWKLLSTVDKEAILKALLDEQHHVCVYCGKRITPDYRVSHIEHFKPQSVHKDQRFVWTNLFASCGPTGKKNAPRICGDFKDKWDPVPVGHIDPTDPNCERMFGYGGNGEIWPTALARSRAQTMIDRLNLDDESLQYERLVIVIEIEERIADGTIGAANQEAEVERWRTVDASGSLLSYGHVAARYLEEQQL